MKIERIALLIAVVVLSVARTLEAGGGSPSCCMCGKKVCVLEVSKAEEDVTCFDVEPKEICIPGIKLPWECTRRCGGVRTVCVLKEEKKKETVCKYDWSLKTICTNCCKKRGLKHSLHFSEVHRDEKVPFEYYTANLDHGEVSVASVELAPASPANGADAARGQSPVIVGESVEPALGSSSRQPLSIIRSATAVIARFGSGTN